MSPCYFIVNGNKYGNYENEHNDYYDLKRSDH